MNRYKLEARVKRTFIDTVSLDVDADSPEEAFKKTVKVLETFPLAHDVDGCPYVYTEHRDNQNSEVIEIVSRENVYDDRH